MLAFRAFPSFQMLSTRECYRPDPAHEPAARLPVVNDAAVTGGTHPEGRLPRRSVETGAAWSRTLDPCSVSRLASAAAYSTSTAS